MTLHVTKSFFDVNGLALVHLYERQQGRLFTEEGSRVNRCLLFFGSHLERSPFTRRWIRFKPKDPASPRSRFLSILHRTLGKFRGATFPRDTRSLNDHPKSIRNITVGDRKARSQSLFALYRT